MSVIEWICDCCGAHLDLCDDHTKINVNIGSGLEDRCQDCLTHLEEHCNKYFRVIVPSKHRSDP